MNDMVQSMGDYEKENKKREAALKARLGKLPNTNSIVAAALKDERNDSQEDKRATDWGIVSKLHETARDQYVQEGKPFKKVMADLSEAISKL